MRVTIIGTGNMGRAIAARALAGGHRGSRGTRFASALKVIP
jgi:3-hydroxyisobutyrate dehydrogenase-like beta-hydroxyacid dehydrogenase